MRPQINLRRAWWLALAFYGVSASAQVQTETFQGQPVVANQVLIKMKTTVRRLRVMDLVSKRADADRFEPVGGAGAHKLHSRSKTVAQLINDLKFMPNVEYVEPDYVVHLKDAPNDPRFNEQWGLRNTGQTIRGEAGVTGADIGAVQAWDLSRGSRGTVVGVVDSGIDYSHPDLAPNIWSAPSEFTVTIGGVAITCPSGSHGFNALNNTCDPRDDEGHGTHVAGTVGALGSNAQVVTGVSQQSTLLGLKFADASGEGHDSGAANAIEFAIQAKNTFGAAADVRILNNSWGGGGFSQTLLDEINRAHDNGMLFVAAAGNDGTDNDTRPHYPSSYAAPNVVAVGATDNRDGRAVFSNVGRNTVHLFAPGKNVLSTIMGGDYGYESGTSMATPHVSGAAALILDKCALNTSEIKANILNNVDAKSALAPLAITGGRLNLNKALRACAPPPGPCPPRGAPVANGPQGAIDSATPTFSWSAVPGAQSSTLYVLRVSDEAIVLRQTGITGTSFVPSSPLPGGVDLRWKVKAESSCGAGPYSGNRFFRIEGVAACSPTDPPVASGPAGTVNEPRPNFAWTPVDRASSYTLHVLRVSDEAVVLRQTDIRGTNFTPSDPLPTGIPLRWKVKGESDCGPGPYSNQLFFDIQGVTACPPNQAPVAEGPAGVIGTATPTFSWSAVPGAASYTLYVLRVSDEAIVMRQTDIAETAFTPTTPLPTGTELRWKVKGESACGPGAYSPSVFFSVVP